METTPPSIQNQGKLQQQVNAIKNSTIGVGRYASQLSRSYPRMKTPGVQPTQGSMRTINNSRFGTANKSPFQKQYGNYKNAQYDDLPKYNSRVI